MKCITKSFDGDLDGIDANSTVTFEWTYTDSKSGIDVSHCVLRRCRHMHYKGGLRPPWQIRAVVCVVNFLFSFEFVELADVSFFG